MKKLIRLSDRVSYLPGFTNIGVILDEGNVVVIDTGIDKSSAKAIIREVEPIGVEFFVFNTHSHADHCGGNFYLKDKLGAKIYVPALEDAFVRYPYLEPFSLFSGACPPPELRIKFLMARGVPVDYVIPLDERKVKIKDVDIAVIPLGGHSTNHIGFVVDDVLFCGDALFSKEIIDKYKITFMVDIGKQLSTLDMLSEVNYRLYVPSHAEPTEDVSGLVSLNRKVINDVIDAILSVLKKGSVTTEQVVADVTTTFGIKMTTQSQYYLMSTTIMAYLSYLHANGVLGMDVKHNKPCWIAE